jgi:hypothetical protein
LTDTGRSSVSEEVDFQLLTDFLESTPPNQMIQISDVSEWQRDRYGSYNVMRTPEIQIHCNHESCNGVRFFRCIEGKGTHLKTEGHKYFYMTYICSNCQRIKKTFSIAAKVHEDEKPAGECYKFGEFPTYGPPVSPKLIKLIGPDREAFLKGRRCENQGLGVGAFIYYRRVIENQKNRVLSEIIKVSEKIGADADSIEALRAAISETQFSKALYMAKDAMPQSLLINGHSPLRLIHSALSEGIHALTDEDCLELAGSIRVVLGDLSERLSQALKDEAELTNALSKLLNRDKS